MMNDENYKVMVAPCKECGNLRGDGCRLKEDAETPVFVGRCPDCQERDPFLKLLKSTRITTLGGLSRRIER